jgi:hypothetical protein
VIVRLHHATILQRDFLQHLAHAIHDRALRQVFRSADVDDVAADVARRKAPF